LWDYSTRIDIIKIRQYIYRRLFILAFQYCCFMFIYISLLWRYNLAGKLRNDQGYARYIKNIFLFYYPTSLLDQKLNKIGCFLYENNACTTLDCSRIIRLSKNWIKIVCQENEKHNIECKQIYQTLSRPMFYNFIINLSNLLTYNVDHIAQYQKNNTNSEVISNRDLNASLIIKFFSIPCD